MIFTWICSLIELLSCLSSKLCSCFHFKCMMNSTELPLLAFSLFLPFHFPLSPFFQGEKRNISIIPGERSPTRGWLSRDCSVPSKCKSQVVLCFPVKQKPIRHCPAILTSWHSFHFTTFPQYSRSGEMIDFDL